MIVLSWRFSLLFLLLSFLLSVPGERTRPQKSVTAAASANIRIMTFNIRYGTANDGENRWGLRRSSVFKLLRDQDPDIIGVQEALRFQLDELRTALPQYGEIGTGRDDGKTAGEYAAILYRSPRFAAKRQGTFWFSDTPDVPGSKSWGNNIPRICTWALLADSGSGKSLYVFNVHLDHESQRSREQSALLLQERIQNVETGTPIIVLGDFNTGEQNLTVRIIQGEDALTDNLSPRRTKFADTYRLIHPRAVEVGTFHAFSGERTGEKIDYIFVSPGVTVLEAEILHFKVDGRYPSDHFPVTARITF